MWGLSLFGFDFWAGILGDVAGNVFSLTTEVNFSAVEISFLVPGALNGRFVRILSAEV